MRRFSAFLKNAALTVSLALSALTLAHCGAPLEEEELRELEELGSTDAALRAGDTIQAEATSRRSTPNPKLENGNTTLGFFDAGTWFCYDDIDLTGVSALELRLAAANSGGIFSVRVGGENGSEIARHTVTATGGWGTWATRSIAITARTGSSSLCFRGESAAGIMNLDSVRLVPTAAQYRVGSTIQAEATSRRSAPNPQLENGNTTLGFFDVGTWFCYDGVDFSGVASLELRMASNNSGGVFSVRAGNETGAELGRMTVSSTGGWSTWTTRTLGLTTTTGVKSLCFRGESGGGITNLDSFRLLGSAPPSGNDVVGHVFAGYQGWFMAQGDNSGMNRWVHWTKNGQAPAPSGNVNFEIYPDLREYTKTYATSLGNLGNGSPARLFSSVDQETVSKHFEWMRTYNIDGAAIQRFGADSTDGVWKAARDSVAVKAKNAAEANGRKFYVMYDITGMNQNTWVSALQSDWTQNIVGSMQLPSSSAYAKQNGKPVVCLWGIGFNDRPGTTAQASTIIDWFKAQGYYVIGGVPTHWRTNDGDSRPDFANVYRKLDMLSPWFVGRFGDDAGIDHYRRNQWGPDIATLASTNIVYQPVMFPGFAWYNLTSDQPNRGPKNQIPRRHGDFMWNQAFALKNLGVNTGYIAMFDEYDEGTAIAKAAENASMVPNNQYFLALDADGVSVSSDFYLRLSGDINRMFQGQIAPTAAHPTSHR